MLPSTGLFKSIACPYYSSILNGITCHRPYCHFKHVKKDELEPNISQAAPAVPEYTPAPKLLKLSCDPVSSLVVQKKKKKLEYRPDQPELQYTKSSRLKQSANSSDVAPIYVPSSSIINLDNCNEELEELTEIFEEQLSQEDAESIVRENGVGEECIESKFSPPTEEVEKHEEVELKFSPPEKAEELQEDIEAKFSPTTEVEENEIIIKQEKEDNKSNISVALIEETLTTNEKASSVTEDVRGKIKTENIDKTSKKTKTSSSSSSKDRHREERRNSTSSSSSARHKHKSSTSSKDRSGTKDSKTGSDTKKDRDKQGDSDVRNKEKVKEKSRDKKIASTSSTSTSKSSSHSKHTVSSSTSSDPKHKKHRSSHASSSSSLKPASSSSLSKKDNKSSACGKPKEHKAKDHKPKSTTSSSRTKSSAPSTGEVHLNEESAELFATSEADIMKECEMIYDQLEQEFATLHQNNTSAQAGEKPQAAALKRKSSMDEEEPSTAAASALQRKRVAYENAEKLKRDVPAFIRKPNHVRNAMQAIYNRQATLRKKQEEEASAAEVALREAEEKVREANEALRKVKAQNLTPLIPKSYLTPPTRMNSRHIMPVANILALERAKKRVEEFKAERRLSFTPAQTAKSEGRVAHKPTVASTKVEPERKPKPPVLECTSTKISFNIRMQYYEMMVKHCLLIYPNELDAYERAQTEELNVFKKCNTPVIYKSSALLAINKLRKEAADSGNKPDSSNKIVSHEVILAGKLAHTTSWSVQKKIKTDSTFGGEPFDKLRGDKAYDMVYDLRLTKEQLVSNGYPRPGKRPGTAAITYWKPMRRPNETERYCSRCGKVFSMSMYDEIHVDECNYHPKSTGYRRGFADSQHRCCQQPAGTPGCTYGNYHVSDYFDVDNLTGYVATINKESDYVPTKKDIYALDCEMCYTTHGIELTRVTVVDINARTVYDALVKPDNKIVDYNTIYSGITEKMLENETRTLRDVQAILMSMFHSKTVLIGHSLESDLKALKLIHSVVVDTSVLFPHKMGPPKKRALKTLCIENLKRIIQENEAGHDSAEDAEVCIQLVKFYLRNKIS